MKRLLTILLLLTGLTAATAQTRTYSDNASKTFIIGLESYFYGENGTLDFKVGDVQFNASLTSGSVSVNGEELEAGEGDSVIGIHDFTGNRNPELVVARRSAEAVTATVYSLVNGQWQQVGKVGSKGASEIRVFRQVVSIRSGEALRSWTWHGDKFDYKASDGSAEPELL